DYRWRFAVPPTGKLPFDDCHPALIQWQGDLHPARALRDHGIRLERLEITHPDAAALSAALAGLTDPRVSIHRGPYHALRATFSTPNGTRVLT
ncbi:MAG TPA: VOC family protein, partial [Tabrizicola sp.]